MSSAQDVLRLYSSSSEEEEEKKQVAEAKDSADVAASDDDSSEAEAEEKVSARKRPREDSIATDLSTVPTRAQQLQKQHQAKIKNTPWPTRLSRAKRHQAKRAPVRYGNTVTHVRGQPQEDPRRHGGL